MELVKIKSKKEIRKFVLMADNLYKDDKKYVPYMKHDLFKTLCKLILKEKTYFAFAIKENNKYVARVLFTISYSKQLKLDKCGFFSFFECINNQECCNMLFDAVCNKLKEFEVTHLQGTYFPFDQDNRRGILVKGFEYEPMILTSYNHPYYMKLLENYGFIKDFDTVAYKFNYEGYDYNKYDPIIKKLEKRFNYYVTFVNFKNIEQEIKDVHEVISSATNDIIFQNAPTLEEIRSIVAGWKQFLWEDFILIARRKDDNKAIGIVMFIPNYFEVFRKMKGSINPIALLKMLYYKNKIKSARGMMQYVLPEYQNKGVNFALYHKYYDVCQKHRIFNIEGGTIMENNINSRVNVEHVTGEIHKVFRLYGKDI